MENKEGRSEYMGSSSKITIEDLLLCTPYETDENRNFKNLYPGLLTKELFNENLYIDPKEDINDTQDDTDDDENIFNYEYSSFSNPITLSEFDKFLITDSIKPLFVRGYSGTGKTTFVNAKLYFLTKDNNNFNSIYFNMQDTKSAVNLFNLEWANQNDHKTIFKLYSILIECINYEINMKEEEINNEEKYKKRLELAYANYKEYFNKSLEIRIDNIFSIINSYINNEIVYMKGFDESFCLKMHKAIESLISYNEDKLSESINNLMKILSIFLYDSSNNKKHFIVFDNIEYYIKKEVVYDHDIKQIVELIRKMLSYMENYFNVNNLTYAKCFKIIIIARDTTQNCIEDDTQQGDTPIREQIDVSELYDINEIIKKKIDYFSDPKNINKSEYFKDIYDNTIVPATDMLNLKKNISQDKNLSIFIKNLFNNNKRRMTILQIKALNRNIDNIIIYKELMEKAKIIKNENISNAYKYGARSIIRRMFLDLFQSTSKDKQGYFSRILAVDPTNNTGLWIARRILVYLYNKSLYNNDEYIGFYTLIKDVWTCPHRVHKIKLLCYLNYIQLAQHSQVPNAYALGYNNFRCKKILLV